LLRQLRKKIKHATKSKTNRLASKLLLILQKDEREGFAGIQPHLTLHQIWTLIVYSALVVFLKTTMEKTGSDVQNVSDGRTYFVLVWRKILFVSLVRDEYVFYFVHSLYALYL
jgi:hypothetical protein